MSKFKSYIFYFIFALLYNEKIFADKYSGKDGNFQISVIQKKSLIVKERPEALSVRISAPIDKQSSPLIIFSHGSRCHVDGSNDLIKYWSSHGYSVIQPLHLDGFLDSRQKEYTREEISFHRFNDMKLILDKMEELLSDKPMIYKKINKSKIIAAGHSYGALVAQSMGGAKTYSQSNPNIKVSNYDRRFKTIVAISPPGYMKNFVDQTTAKSIKIPMLVTTGTKDMIPPFMPTWDIHTVTYHDSLPGKKYLAVINNADHWFGGLLCRKTENKEQNKEMLILKAVTLAFMDYALNNNNHANKFLNRLLIRKSEDGIFDFQSK